MANTTRKKVKIVGKKQYLDPAPARLAAFSLLSLCFLRLFYVFSRRGEDFAAYIVGNTR